MIIEISKCTDLDRKHQLKKMKILYFLSLLILFFSCNGKHTSPDKSQENTKKREIVVPKFQAIIDSANVEGAILIYNSEDDTYYSNDYEWTKKGHLPASTYKITNSIIALETGVE